MNKKQKKEPGVLVNSVMEHCAQFLVDQLFRTSPFETDEIITEWIPKYYFKVSIPYIRYDREDEELRIGLESRTLFTLGKKKIERHAMLWESKKKTGKVIKFSRYSDLTRKSDNKENV